MSLPDDVMGAAIVGVLALVIIKEVFAFVKWAVEMRRPKKANGNGNNVCALNGPLQHKIEHINGIMGEREGGDRLIYGAALKKPLQDLLAEQKETTLHIKTLADEIRISRQDRQ